MAKPCDDQTGLAPVRPARADSPQLQRSRRSPSCHWRGFSGLPSGRPSWQDRLGEPPRGLRLAGTDVRAVRLEEPLPRPPGSGRHGVCKIPLLRASLVGCHLGSHCSPDSCGQNVNPRVSLVRKSGRAVRPRRAAGEVAQTDSAREPRAFRAAVLAVVSPETFVAQPLFRRRGTAAGGSRLAFIALNHGFGSLVWSALRPGGSKPRSGSRW